MIEIKITNAETVGTCQAHLGLDYNPNQIIFDISLTKLTTCTSIRLCKTCLTELQNALNKISANNRKW